MQKNRLYKNFFNFFCLILLSLILSCKSAKPLPNPFLLSILPHIQEFEKQDHLFCSSLKIDFDKNEDLFNSQNYWRCRLSLAKYRLTTDKSAENAKHNLEISDLVTKISLKVSQTSETILMHENKKLDERHHQQCLKMGYEVATVDQSKIDDYFACRFALIKKYEEPPYGNEEYLKYPNNSYNSSFVIDQRLQKNIEIFSDKKAKYPACLKFNIYSEDFKKCEKAHEESSQCYATIDRKKFLKEWEEKIRCQKGAYNEFPDNFLKFENEQNSATKKTNNNSDYYNQNSFAALGIDEKQFSAQEIKAKSEEEKAAEKRQKQKELRAEINSKNKLYDKYELTKLRQKYIRSCQKEADFKVEKYLKKTKDDCENLKNLGL